MKTLNRSVVFGALGAVVSLAIGCGGPNDGGGGGVGSVGSVTADPAPVVSSLRSGGRHRPAVVQPAGTGGAPATPPADPPPATGDVNAAIAAAQTADGQAIPQPAGPDGSCPRVLVMLGFWSCPTLGQTCSYTASGVAHSCACDRTDGEGQTPSWVCDQ